MINVLCGSFVMSLCHTLLFFIAFYFFYGWITLYYNDITLDDNEKFSELQLNSLKRSQLHSILESRGIPQFGYKEKKDLVKLVFSTGSISNEELSEIMATKHDMSDVHFRGENRFQWSVDHSMEDVWLIRTQQSEDVYSSCFDNSNWNDVKSILIPAGIKTGVLHCFRNETLNCSICGYNKWNTLILATPGNWTTYDGLGKPRLVIEWVRDILMTKVMVVKTDEEHKYLGETKDLGEINDVQMMLVLPPDTEPPLMYLILSASLSHRISFGIAYANHAYPLLEETFGNSITSLSTAKYFISTPTSHFEYGKESGEHLNFNQMKLKLNTLRPPIANVVYNIVLICYLLMLVIFCMLLGCCSG
ncbi:hypothetical protein CHUAL_011316 [Chamberlinius hualienensis]